MSDVSSRRPVDFDQLHQQPDPFGLRTSWYEQRKRALVTAALPRRAFERGWEIGCSNGELTAALAERCSVLLATDVSPRAVSLARARNAENPHVIVERSAQPEDWPDGTFDLIVLSEVGYYLDHCGLRRTISKAHSSLTPNGVLVACHWLAPFEAATATGSEVHALIARCLPLARICRYQDADFLLDVWCAETSSVANREGLK